MRTITRRVLFVASLTLAFLGGPGVRTLAAQRSETLEEFDARRRQRESDERNLNRMCGKALKNYQYRQGELEGAKRRGHPDDVLAKRQKARDQALEELCRCLQRFHGVYGNLPAAYEEFEKLCFPPAGAVDPGPSVAPDESQPPVDPPYIPAPDTQLMPVDPAAPDAGPPIPDGAPETEMDPCEKLADDIKTLEELQKHYGEKKMPQPLKRKLAELRRAYAECQKPDAGASPGDPDTSIGRPPTGLPGGDKTPGTGAKDPGAAPPPGTPPGGGAFLPGNPQSGCAGLDAFFGGEVVRETRLKPRFVKHSADHSKHCSFCSQLLRDITARIERNPNACVAKVTVTNPAMPGIDCTARPDGGFDCVAARGDFCQLAPEVQVEELELRGQDVVKLHLTVRYPEDELCVIATPP